MVSFSTLIITHAREELLMKCLDSLRPPLESWQLVILFNGAAPSEKLKTYLDHFPALVTILHSETLLTPGRARNLALEKVEGEWVFFLDDDAYLLPKYWEAILPVLQNQKIDVVGGPDTEAPGMNYFSRSLATALSSPLCTGATFSRHKKLGNKMVFTDEEKLTSCNLWVRKSAIEGIQFPEDYLRAEETIFLQKLTQKQAGMFYLPKLVVAHFRRKTLFLLVKPTFYSGFFRSRSMREKLGQDAMMFWLPSLFVLLHFLIFLDLELFWMLTKLYMGLILTVSLGLSARKGAPHLAPMVAFLHYFIVFVYGVGFMMERVGGKKWK